LDYESLMEVIRKRRTVRVYRERPIPDSFIEKVIEAARWGPTGANTQPFEFVVVKDKRIKKKISDIFSGNSMLSWGPEV